MKAKPKGNKRTRELAAIHIALQQLQKLSGLDDGAYRAIVRRVSAAHGREVDSSGKCNDQQRRALLDELRRLGATRPGNAQIGAYPGKPHNWAKLPEMVSKIEAQLADMGLPWSYADAIAQQQCGIARVAWVRDEEKLRAIIAALDVEQRKRSAGEFIDQAVEKLGLSEKQFAELTAKLPRHWRRQLKPLGLVCDHLQARLEMLAAKEGSSRMEGDDHGP